MEHVNLATYQAAKNEILFGHEFCEVSKLDGNTIHKIYVTKDNGEFCEVNNGGRVEFWSSKHSKSRIYDENQIRGNLKFQDLDGIINSDRYIVADAETAEILGVYVDSLVRRMFSRWYGWPVMKIEYRREAFGSTGLAIFVNGSC